MYQVTSEIYKETNFQPVKISDGKVISKFKFIYPNEQKSEKSDDDNFGTTDKDGDFVVRRRRQESATIGGQIEIEHSVATEIRLVGLQVWRGALLLADFFFHKRKDLEAKQILELGAGVGLTSIAAAIYARKVICTDVDLAGILNLIRANVERNQKLLPKGNVVEVLECDFKKQPRENSAELVKALDDSDIVLAADVIYDDDLTDAFISVIDNIFDREKLSGRQKTIYVALEKRFVFTLTELDAVAPMFEYFLKQTANKPWHVEDIPLDFPQYFEYERCQQLVLLRITSS